ncbi:MAG: hypothetical protein U9N33_02525 [Campylobacterota bacterium]|nr:hypothetical protein [Campylobacterota bacterium]
MPTLYFLRSSEQKITTDMLHYVMRLDEVSKRLEDIPQLASRGSKIHRRV